MPVARIIKSTLLAATMLTAVLHPAGAAGMDGALHAYYTAEKDALPATAAAGALAAVFGGVLLRRRQRFSTGLGLPFLLIGAATSIGSLAYLSQVDERHASYAKLLNESPALYLQTEGAHLDIMQRDFQRIIWIDSSVAVAGLGLAVVGATRNRRFVQGLGMGTLLSAAALGALEMHNSHRASEYANAFHSFVAHTTLQVGGDLTSLSLDFQTTF